MDRALIETCRGDVESPLLILKMKRIVTILTSPPLLLAIVAILAYGLLIPQLGFYWDDLPMSWIRYQLGPEAMTLYFSTNRPVWGLLYQLTTRLFPQVPIYWQVFALFWRWLTGLLAWAIVRELFPKKERLALSTALLFLLYPGFNQQWGAFLYSHFFIVLNFFLLSLFLMLRAQKERFWTWTSLSMLCSALNLWMHEYFFTLEAARIAILWISLRDQKLDLKTHLRRTFSLWTPYLAVFMAAVLSRLFIFNNQIYGIGGDQVNTIPFNIFTTIPTSIWTVTVAAWAQVFRIPDLAVDGPRTTLMFGVITLVVYGVVIAVLFEKQAEGTKRDGLSVEATWAMGLGVFILFVAGWPFWLTGVPVSLGYPANRATLSFMLGVSLLIAGLLSLLPRRLEWILLAVFVALAAGRQFQWSNEFRRDWNMQKNMFWQMTWRVPALEPNTVVMMNEKLNFYADNSIGAALNWIYAPDNHSNHLDYVLFYPTNRLEGALTALESDVPINYDYLAAQFEGNTSQMVVFYYAPPGCLRLLDPEIDPNNRLIPDETILRDAAKLSSTKPVLSETVAIMPSIYAPEPPKNWCYYFEKADLARQIGDWEKVAQFGDMAFKLDDYPNDPIERFVFIEGYTHVGEWKKALEYAQVSYKVSKNYVGPLLCHLWDRIEREVPSSAEKDSFVTQAKTLFVC